MDTREAFERSRANFYPADAATYVRNPNGEYRYPTVEKDWQWWQAALKQPPMSEDEAAPIMAEAMMDSEPIEELKDYYRVARLAYRALLARGWGSK